MIFGDTKLQRRGTKVTEVGGDIYILFDNLVEALLDCVKFIFYSHPDPPKIWTGLCPLVAWISF